MKILLANLPGALLAGFLSWLAVQAMPSMPVLGWFLISMALLTLGLGFYSFETTKRELP